MTARARWLFRSLVLLGSGCGGELRARAGNVAHDLEMLKMAPRAVRYALPEREFKSMEDIMTLDEATLITGIRTNPDARQWKAWDRWEIENLVQIKDYFSSVQHHNAGEGTTFYNVAYNDTLGMRGGRISLENRYTKMFIDEIFDCSDGVHKYVPGGTHPVFDGDLRPKDAFRYPEGMTYFDNLYWASKGTNTYSHYDRETVFLVQISGEKHVLVNPPSELNAMQLQPALHPSARQSAMPISPCNKILDPEEWPSLKNMTKYAFVKLTKGDALYLPPLWFHSVCNLSPSTAISFKGSNPKFQVRSVLEEPMRGLHSVVWPYWQSLKANINSSKEGAMGVIAYQVVDVLGAALKELVPDSMKESGVEWLEARYLFEKAESRYGPHAGSFLDDDDVEGLPCEYLTPWSRDFGVLNRLRKAMLKKLKEPHLAPSFTTFMLLGRYPGENELQDAVEFVLESLVGGRRVNAVLRAVGVCTGSNRGGWPLRANANVLEKAHDDL